MSDYIDLEEGSNVIWLTDVKFERGTNDKPRNKIRLYLAASPSKETHTCKTTIQDIYLPKTDDQTQAKIAMEKRIKAILYPLAGLKPEDKCSIKSLFEGIQAYLSGHDLQLGIHVTCKQGNNLDRDGNPKIFSEITSVIVMGHEEKTAYVSDVDLEDVPF